MAGRADHDLAAGFEHSAHLATALFDIRHVLKCAHGHNGVEVRVVGTEFTVSSERDGDSRRVQVDVQRGVVEVRSSSQPGEVFRLPAGRSWSQVTKTGPVTRPAPEPPPAPEPAPAEAKPEVVEAAPAGPRELLEEANELRRKGNAREAAKLYETLLNRYGSDGRAGLAQLTLAVFPKEYDEKSDERQKDNGTDQHDARMRAPWLKHAPLREACQDDDGRCAEGLVSEDTFDSIDRAGRPEDPLRASGQ